MDKPGKSMLGQSGWMAIFCICPMAVDSVFCSVDFKVMNGGFAATRVVGILI